MTEETYNGIVWRRGHSTILRPLEDDDADHVYRIINNPQNNQYLNTIFPMGLGFEKEWVKKKQQPSENDITMAVLLHDGTFIGTMGLHQINHLHGTATTGAVLDAPYCGKGYGTDAKMMLLEYAFNWLGLYKVQSHTFSFNGRSAAYSHKCGYREEGRLKGQFQRFGQRYDEIILSVFREEWLPLWKEFSRDL